MGGVGGGEKRQFQSGFKKKFWHGVPLYFDIFQCEKKENNTQDMYFNSNSNYALIRINYYLLGVEFLYLSLAGGGGGAAAKNVGFKVVSKKKFGRGAPYILTFSKLKK